MDNLISASSGYGTPSELFAGQHGSTSRQIREFSNGFVDSDMPGSYGPAMLQAIMQRETTYSGGRSGGDTDTPRLWGTAGEYEAGYSPW